MIEYIDPYILEDHSDWFLTYMWHFGGMETGVLLMHQKTSDHRLVQQRSIDFLRICKMKNWG